MSLVKCKCGVYTSNGLFCVSCYKDFSMDLSYYSPEEIDEDELDEYGFTIVELEDINYDEED